MDEPECENCEKPASLCNCWDNNQNMELIIAYKLQHGLLESRWLKPKNLENE